MNNAPFDISFHRPHSIGASSKFIKFLLRSTCTLQCKEFFRTEEFLALERAGAPQEELNKLATGTNRMGSVEGDIKRGVVQVGQSLNVLKDILPCKEVIERMISEAKATLSKAKDIEL